MGCFKSNALALRHSHRSPRNESDSGRLFGSLAAFKFAIGASFKKLQSDSFQNGFVPHPILLFQKIRGWLSLRSQRLYDETFQVSELRATSLLREPYLQELLAQTWLPSHRKCFVRARTTRDGVDCTCRT